MVKPAALSINFIAKLGKRAAKSKEGEIIKEKEHHVNKLKYKIVHNIASLYKLSCSFDSSFKYFFEGLTSHYLGMTLKGTFLIYNLHISS